jgi:hypothetical protein
MQQLVAPQASQVATVSVLNRLIGHRLAALSIQADYFHRRIQQPHMTGKLGHLQVWKPGVQQHRPATAFAETLHRFCAAVSLSYVPVQRCETQNQPASQPLVGADNDDRTRSICASVRSRLNARIGANLPRCGINRFV